ncbi:MAG: hypothetical protein R2819_02385 [Allomuricauda sp.]
MDRNHHILFNTLLFALASMVCQAQEKTKTYTETFTVGNDAVLNIDTSHADIEFETWDKNQIEVTAIVELEGATDEQAKTYFEKDAVKIVGNSKEVEVRTLGSGLNTPFVQNFEGFDIVIPDVPSVDDIMENIEIPEIPDIPEVPEIFVIPELPPMPPMPLLDFDYEAYKKDGEKYLKEWKKNFDKNFDKEYKEHLEEWSKQMEEMAEQREKEREQMRKDREKMLEDREKMREEAKAQRDELRHQRDELRHQISTERNITIQSDDNGNIYYFSSDGESKKYKVKKYIKIKMPKSVKLKMNVRHGEVKLAENTKNINASLSYASLHASTIDGNRTDIRASYSPVIVQKWNYGQLKTDYSDKVSLKEVKDLKLNSVSSNVVIDRLLDKALVTNNLGTLQIKSIADGFTNVDISVENGEVDCRIPSVPFTIYVNETTSDFKYPEKLAIGSSKTYSNNVHKGYYINNKDGKSININSKYSEIVLKE